VTTLALSSADLATLAGDVLVVATVPAGGRRKGAVLAGPATALKAAPRKKLEEALAALGATGKAGDVVTVPGAGIAAAPVVLAVGLGAEPHTDEALRRAAGTATRAAAGHKRAILALPTPTPSALDAVAQGAALGAYSYTEYRHASKAAQKSAVTRVTLHVRDAKDPETVAALARARAVATAVGLARDLVNTRPRTWSPRCSPTRRSRRSQVSRSRSRSSTTPRSRPAATAGSWAWAAARPTARAWSVSPTVPPTRARTCPSWARASPSTPAASPSSPREHARDEGRHGRRAAALAAVTGRSPSACRSR
jgi:hypothetical protein